METLPAIIKGGSHSDERGTICFVNDFDMALVKRFYRIKHHETSVVRGWRGHKIEQRWFHVLQGTFMVNLVKIDNWEKPSPNLEQHRFILKDIDNAVLHIPVGYASCLQAMEENSEVVVFADYPITNAESDNYLYPSDFFIST